MVKIEKKGTYIFASSVKCVGVGSKPKLGVINSSLPKRLS